jgi:rubrerythrin
MRTSSQWWNEIKSNPEELKQWLIRQYVGEMAAVNLLSDVLIRFGGDMAETEWDDVYKVMMQEAKHARWVKELLADRHIGIPAGLDATRRYWEEVIPAVEKLDDAAHAAHNAEEMRLHRIRTIAEETDPAYADLQNVFQRILPDEEWHERVFDGLCRTEHNPKMDTAHNKGLRALSLVLS